MKIKISSDARPQVRTLLVATAITVALWFIPYADILTYPFRIFVTFIHEGGHALAALLTGNSVESLSVAVNGSGLVKATHDGIFSTMIVSSAGYLGATAYGALLLVLIRRAVAARRVLIGSAAFILTMTLIYGFLTPLTNGFSSALFGIPFTLIAGVVLSLTLIAIAIYASPRVATFFISFLAVQCVLNALLDLKTIFLLTVPGTLDQPSDAANMANATGIPAMFWAVIWIGLSFLLLSMAMRFYAISRHQKETQQDLPFEEPLEV